jgi:DNA replication protein DnaC
MIKIKPLDKPDLGHTKMNCDNVINEKLLKYPMIEEAFSTTSFNIICGRMGQGKTSLLTALLKKVFKKCFETIYVFMPSNSRESIDNDIYGKNLPPEQLFDTLTPENLSQVYEEIQDHSKEKYNSLIIIDDFQAALKDPTIIKTLQKIITKMRHLRTTIFLLQQNFQALAKPLRELTSNLIVFNLGKSQLEKIFEVIQLHKDKYQQIIDICFQDPHDWILINLHKSRNIYKMFDLLEIPK